MKNSLGYRFSRYLLTLDALVLIVIVLTDFGLSANLEKDGKFIIAQLVTLVIFAAYLYFALSVHKDLIFTKKEIIIKPFGSYFFSIFKVKETMLINRHV